MNGPLNFYNIFLGSGEFNVARCLTNFQTRSQKIVKCLNCNKSGKIFAFCFVSIVKHLVGESFVNVGLIKSRVLLKSKFRNLHLFELCGVIARNAC